MIYHWKALDVYFPMPLKSPHLDFPSSSYAPLKRARSGCPGWAFLWITPPITCSTTPLAQISWPGRCCWSCQGTRQFILALATCSTPPPWPTHASLNFNLISLFLGPKDDSDSSFHFMLHYGLLYIVGNL